MSGTSRALTQKKAILEGDWSEAESERILAVLQKIEVLSGGGIAGVFNHQPTTFRHSGRAGRVGRTLGGTVELDAEWTDWTLAHELGHRWNNAWQRHPERDLRTSLQAGRLEWLKYGLRRFEKWLERLLRKLGIKTRIDWQALWYHPGSAAPPCGADRNFNASEDLAECFAASVFPEKAKERAARAAKRVEQTKVNWDWGKQHDNFSATPRGQYLKRQLRAIAIIDPDERTYV